MSEPSSSVTERSPFDAKPLDAEEYRELLAENPDLVLRVSDGTSDGTYRFWVEDGSLFWRCLNWFSPQESDLVHLSATLDSDTTTQLLIERSTEPETEKSAEPDQRVGQTAQDGNHDY